MNINIDIKPENIYQEKIHAIQRVLATTNYVLIGVEEHKNNRKTFSAHEVGITRLDAQNAVLTVGDHYMNQIEEQEPEVMKR